MSTLSQALVAQQLHVIRFDFHYMTAAKKAGKPRPPAKMPVLVEQFRELAQSLPGPLFVGGKSLGGRVASHLVTELKLEGLLLFGYPFHPPGKPDKLRTEHLADCLCPALVCQGERDPFGKRVEVETYTLPASFQLFWLEDGDHQFKPPKRSEATAQGNIDRAAAAAGDFVRDRLKVGKPLGKNGAQPCATPSS